jgi:hypothetical protein
MPTQKTKTWDVLQDHPIAAGLEPDAQLALLCEYVDLIDELEGMPLGEFIDSYFAGGDAAPEGAPDGAGEGVEAEPSAKGDGGEARPKSLVGLRVVYRFPGRNILSDEAGVISDSSGVVSFTDVDGEPWSNVARDKVHPIDPANYREIHISPREAKEIGGWLAGGKPVKGHDEGTVLRNLTVDFPGWPERIVFAIMNGRKPFVDRFVMLPNNGFEDDQKPTTRLFGEHCFRVRGEDHVVKVVTP